MSNILGKTIIGVKKSVEAVANSSFGTALNEATNNITENTKKVVRMSVLKAEMEDLYQKLGKAVFDYGMIEENELALSYMKELLEKKFELDYLEKTHEDCKCTEFTEEDCVCNGECDCHDIEEHDCEECSDCKDDCECECHDETEKSEEIEE